MNYSENALVEKSSTVNAPVKHDLQIAAPSWLYPPYVRESNEDCVYNNEQDPIVKTLVVQNLQIEGPSWLYLPYVRRSNEDKDCPFVRNWMISRTEDRDCNNEQNLLFRISTRFIIHCMSVRKTVHWQISMFHS